MMKITMQLGTCVNVCLISHFKVLADHCFTLKMLIYGSL